MSILQMFLGAGAGGDDKLYVDDVLSTFLYEGNAGSQSINNGIDLEGEGGLVWLKCRTAAERHSLQDTERGVNLLLDSSDTIAQSSMTSVNAFNSNGFSLNSSNGIFNDAGYDYTSWTFRKAPGFFDVVTYEGTGNAHAIPHSLASVPGMVVVKKTSGTGGWMVYHKSTGATKYLMLNNDGAEDTFTNYWNDTAPTSTHFTVGSSGDVNQLDEDYIAYVFADDDQQFGKDEDESIIKCGEFDAGGSGDVAVTLGFEPQWLLVKKYSGPGGDWLIHDHMRGFGAEGGTNYRLRPNSDGTEGSYGDYLRPNSDGFIVDGANLGNHQYVYMAIRRPMKTPKAATEVFSVDDQSSGSGSGSVSFSAPSFPIDLMIAKRASSNADWKVMDRMRGYDKALTTNDTSKESTEAYLAGFDQMSGYTVGTNGGVLDESDSVTYCFKRAPGFMDIVCWTGDGSSVQNVSHNLEKAPEMVISKMRLYSSSSSYGGDRWYVYHKDAGGALGLNEDSGIISSDTIFNSTPTATNLPFENTSSDSLAVTGSGKTYVAYLFATLDGISKVGSETVGSSAIDVNCGFTGGARFVLIKRTDATGDWYVYDTTRGIASGNDDFLLLNEADAESSNDYIDPLTTGFKINTSLPAGDYIYLAIA